jgi:hypothetical protein
MLWDHSTIPVNQLSEQLCTLSKCRFARVGVWLGDPDDRMEFATAPNWRNHLYTSLHRLFAAKSQTGLQCK